MPILQITCVIDWDPWNERDFIEPMTTAPSSLTFVATQAALRAGELLRKGFGLPSKVTTKEGIQNLVTEYDTASEKSIMAFIHSHFPSHGFLAEESGFSQEKKPPVLWIIDPLDGTVNFAHGIPLFTVSIAACVDGKILCGVVYQPMSHELFVAESGKGAYLNGTSLKTSSTTQFEKAILATGFPYNVHENPSGCIDRFSHMSKLGVPIRRFGSAALDLAYVACGKFDAYWELSLKPWDICAGKLLVEESGGKVTHYDGSSFNILSPSTLLASNGSLHEKMVLELNKPL